MERPKPLERKVIARPEDYMPSHPDSEVVGAFNSGATLIKDAKDIERILLLTRIAEKYKGDERKEIHLPFYHIPSSPPKIDFDVYLRKRFYHMFSENRVKVYQKAARLPDGRTRLRHISHSRILILDKNGNVIERKQEAAIPATGENDRFGMEDDRITQIENRSYLITHTGPHRREAVSTAILQTDDFQTYRALQKENTPRQVIPGKDVAIFPKKVRSPSTTEAISRGQMVYAAYTRYDGHPGLSSPGIWLSHSPDLIHWGQHHRLTEEGRTTGTGPPPLELEDMWFTAYHQIYEGRKFFKKTNEYKTHLMSVDLEEPWAGYKSSGVLLERADYRDLLPYNGYTPNTVYTQGMVFIENGEKTVFSSGIDDSWGVIDIFKTEDLLRYHHDS